MNASKTKTPTAAQITRLVLANSSDPQGLSGAPLLERVRAEFRQRGLNPGRATVFSVAAARKHCLENCGKPLTREGVRGLIERLALDPTGKSKRAQGMKPNPPQPAPQPAPRRVTPVVTLPPADVVEVVQPRPPAQAPTAYTYTIEQIEQTRAFLDLFKGDAAKAGRLLRLIGGE